MLNNNQISPHRLLLWSGLFLLFVGLIMVYSSSAVYAGRNFGNESHFFSRQLLWLGLGLLSMLVFSNIPTHALRRFAVPLFFLGLLACIIVLIPGIGKLVGGARRWISLGSISVQASELAKLSIIIYLAAILARRQEHNNHKPPLLLIGLLVQIPIGLILLEPDFGTAVLIELMVILMIFSAGLKLRYLFTGILLVFPILYYMVINTPYRLKRLLAWLFPWEFRQDLGYQVTEALISMGSGGLSGVGIGRGKQKLFFLPEAHTDFIFAIIGEELGLLGAFAIVIAFVLITYIGLKTALREQDPFRRYLALGLTLMLSIPALTNLSVVLGLLPPKGLPLPFLSYGGSHIIVCMIALGILIGLSKHAFTDSTSSNRLKEEHNA